MLSQRVPQLCRHKGTGQGYVTLNGVEHYLGAWPARQKLPPHDIRKAYEELVSRWLAHGRSLPDPETGLTVNDVLLAYVNFAEGYYRDGERSTELGCIKDAIALVKELWGRTQASEFGPKRLKAVREKMLDRGWCRSYTNHQIDRVRRVFRWGAEEELISGEVYHALQAVRGIRRGMQNVRESEPVKPVPQTFVGATLQHLPPPVAAMVRLQLLTGMRPGEACAMRTCDLDTTGRVWTYRPGSDAGPHGRHKTAHHGKDRTIFVGPQAQAILKPWLKTELTAPIFSPAEAEAARNAERRKQRKTPCWPSHMKRLVAKRKKNPRRPKRDRYDVAAYRRAIKRACALADVPNWHPHQLRHNAATNLRKEFGVELARIILGHSSLLVTAIYAEADQQQAMEVVAKVG